VHLRFNPVVDLRGREAPLSADFLAGQVAAVGQLAYLANIAL
jgi:hypothetical protein